jgi:hypothetical protein
MKAHRNLKKIEKLKISNKGEETPLPRAMNKHFHERMPKNIKAEGWRTPSPSSPQNNTTNN